eukprot:1375621-Karenia_brevis.AAC.1
MLGSEGSGEANDPLHADFVTSEASSSNLFPSDLESPCSDANMEASGHMKGTHDQAVRDQRLFMELFDLHPAVAQQQPEHDETDDEGAAEFWNDLREADDPRLTVSAQWMQFVSDKGGTDGM